MNRRAFFPALAALFGSLMSARRLRAAPVPSIDSAIREGDDTVVRVRYGSTFISMVESRLYEYVCADYAVIYDVHPKTRLVTVIWETRDPEKAQLLREHMEARWSW